MKGWVGHGVTMVIAFIAFGAFIALIATLFLAPSSATGLPEAFSYFSGVFTRG